MDQSRTFVRQEPDPVLSLSFLVFFIVKECYFLPKLLMITCLFLPHTTHASQSGLEGKTAWNSCPVYWSLSFFAIANSVKRDERTTTKGNESEQLSVLKKLVFSFVQRFFALFTPLDSSCLVFLFKLWVRSFSVSAKFNFSMCITSSTVNGLIIARRKKYVKKRQLKPKEREKRTSNNSKNETTAIDR